MLKTLLLPALLSLTINCMADTGAKNINAYEACLKQSESITPRILDCMSTEYERSDKQLNLTYQKLYKQLSINRRLSLQNAQKLWISYTEANCGFYYDPDGGSDARLSANQCAIDARHSRAKELASLIPQN